MVDMTLVRTAIRAFQLFCTLVLTALIGNVIASNIDAAGSATAAINFTMFVAVVCWLAVLLGLAAAFAGSLNQPIIQLPLDGAATLFTFIDAIVLAAKLRAINCATIDRKDLGDDYIAFGSADDVKRCREIQASTAFMWFLFGSFVVTLLLTLRDYKSGGFRGSVRSGPASTMSQVRV
jgi:hypothetical protein